MVEHYTQSKACRNLNLLDIAALTETQAYEVFKLARWSDGNPVCPKCESPLIITFRHRRIFGCKTCRHQFSVTSGTILAHRKLPYRKLLYLMAGFVTNAKGRNSVEGAISVGCRPMSAWLNAQKFREVMAADTADLILNGVVEIDGMYTGKYRRKANWANKRVDRRKIPSPNQKVIGVARQRGGKTITTVNKHETQSIPFFIKRINEFATVHADEAQGWNAVDKAFRTERINHKECYSDGTACTNLAESFFSRVRRSEIGIYHIISKDHADLYAGEMAWRENHARVDNAERYRKLLVATLRKPVSRRFKGYYQRHARRGRP